MERLYCTINEEQARIAHDMMSMSDYKVGSKTEEYRGYVDKAYDLAEKVAEARPRETDRVEALAKRYSKRMAEYMNRESNIGCRCPSVMISGAGNFPVKKKEKQVQAWEKNHQFYTETQKILDKIKGILRGKDIIKSSDEDAIERLEEKLDALKENQERMRAVNKAIRLKNTKKGDEELKILGYSDEQIQELRTPDFMGRVGFPAYALQNNNANIHRVEERVKSLKAVKEKGTKETEFELFKVVENVEAMRLQIIFDEKPEADVRAVLKKNGFKWAPSQGAWQRMLNPAGKYALILDKIKGILRGKDIIKSSDEDAIERLEEKLDALKENQERMRAVNKAIRLKNTKKGDEELKILGYSDEQIQELRTPDFMGRVGFPAYALQNNNANIHRVEERVKSLKAVKEKGTKETEFELFKVVENVEAMRLQIIFDEKPEADVRAVLKKNGFKWAPSQGAWQRMLNPAGKYALNRVKEELEAV